ncbi:NADH-quinone oxidoreductase subunit K, partial [Staphylococcus epidermidis]|uniref:NADH-quinone oxidoreductase subunit K n=1 Tax=Staphylococcus epidermidis TaxID=1282 RepID=UPI001C92E4A4
WREGIVEIIMMFVSGIVTCISVYVVLCKSLIGMIMGSRVVSDGANLFLISMGGLKEGSVGIFEKGR